jgi:hypothetical protein
MLKCHHEALKLYRFKMDDKCGGLKTVENIEELNHFTYIDALNLYTPHVQVYGEETCTPFIGKTHEVNLQFLSSIIMYL